uniref:Uncharacterized protein n=1 Tax=Aegilops tauschii subsp. strangulata TaxID=200361 RepID=A0A453EKG4_AEGTS
MSFIISFANNHLPLISNASHCYFYAFSICTLPLKNYLLRSACRASMIGTAL